MADFRHSPYWKHRFAIRVQFFKGSVYNHVCLDVTYSILNINLHDSYSLVLYIRNHDQNDLLRCKYMSSTDVIYIPDPRKDFASRDKETAIALVSLENSYITNSKYVQYINSLPAKDKRRVKDLALFQHNGKKPRIFTSIYSGVITIPVRI